MLNFGRRFLLIIEAISIKSIVAAAKGLNMVLERPLVLEIGTTNTVPNLATIFLMSPPVALDRKGFAALSTHEGLDAVLALVVSLEGAEVLERPRPRVVNVVLAPGGATVTR